MWGDGADRVDDVWQMSDGSSALAASLDDVAVDHALLAYAQRAAAKVGSEWFAAELQRREEEEQRGHEAPADAVWAKPEIAPAPVVADQGLVDASAEDQLVGGAPSSMGIGPPPAPPAPEIEPTPVVRHPHVPRPPVHETEPEPRRRRGSRRHGPEPSPAPPHITAPEWARMSPGARRLYGLDETQQTAQAG